MKYDLAVQRILKRLSVFLVMMFILLSAAPVLAEETAPIKVACVGDSLTYSYLSGNQAQKSYPARLQTLLGDAYEVRNFGVNSKTMMDGLSDSYVNTDQYTQSLNYNPDIVILMLGTNDSKPKYWNMEENVNGAKFEQDAKELVASYQSLASDPRIIFAVSPMCLRSEDGESGIKRNIFSDEIVPLQRKIAQENAWEMIDMYEYTKNQQAIYLSDGIHFTDAGYYYEAVCMYEAITGKPVVPKETVAVKNAISPTGETGQTVIRAIDNDYETKWHSTYTPSTSPRDQHYAILELKEKSLVSGLYYLPRQDSGSGGMNGVITKYEIYISDDGGQSYKIVAQGDWAENQEWKHAEFTTVEATHVKLVSAESVEAVAGNALTSAAEIKIIGVMNTPEPTQVPTPTVTATPVVTVEPTQTPEPTQAPAPSVTATPEPIKNPFIDVIEGEFYYDPVLWAVSKNITTGVEPTLFAPYAGCSRAQIVTFLWRAADRPLPKTDTCTFKDIIIESYYYEAMLWAVGEGIATGYNADTFAPDKTCTRGEMVTFLYRAMDKPEITNKEHPFKDVSEKEFYYEPMLWALENKITTGQTAAAFAPDKTVTRGETVTFLYRTYK